MIIDTHGHYDDEQFDVDREMLLTNLKERGLKAIVTVGASMQTSENALALAHQYPAVYAAVGVHPDEVGELNDDALARLEEMCHDPKVVAVVRSVLITTGMWSRERFNRSGSSDSLIWRERSGFR